MDHSELIAELPLIEKLTPAERIQLARQRRTMQLLKWRDREKAEFQMAPLIEQRNRRVKFGANIALLEATARNDVEEVRRLLQNGADPNLHNEDGLTALHQCAIDNNEELMLLLISRGADVNARDTELWTPLHAGGCCGHIKIVRHLIENGAELLAVNADGNMPYDICEDEQTLDYIESEMAKRGITQEDIDEERLATERQMLADVERHHKTGQNLECRDENGATLLHVACANGFYLVVHFLLEVGASVHARDNDGWQAVHASACWNQPDCLELLVNYGADINARTPAGETPFDLCEDDTVRAVIMTLQVEQRRRLLSFARDSRRMSRRKKPSSKFESPPQAIGSDAHLSASRGAIRRHSLRDRAGVTLARLEARKEAASLLRSWSFEDSSPNPNAPDAIKSEEQRNGELASTSLTNDANAVVNTSSVILVSHDDDEDFDDVIDTGADVHGLSRQVTTDATTSSNVVGVVVGGQSSSAAQQHISTSQWLQKIQKEERYQHQQHQHYHYTSTAVQQQQPDVPSRKKPGSLVGGRKNSQRDKKSSSGDVVVNQSDIVTTSSTTVVTERPVDVVTNGGGNNGGVDYLSKVSSTQAPPIGGDDVALLSRHPLTLSDLKRLRAEERQSTTTAPSGGGNKHGSQNVSTNQQQHSNSMVNNNVANNSRAVSSSTNASEQKNNGSVAMTTVDGPTARFRAPSDTVIGGPGSSLRGGRSKLGGLKCCCII